MLDKFFDKLINAIEFTRTLISGQPKGYDYSIRSDNARKSLNPLFSAPREPYIGYLLNDLVMNSGDAITTIESAQRDVFSSPDGSDRTFWIAELNQAGEKVDPDLLKISDELFNRQEEDEFLIGGTKLYSLIENCFAYGDNFMEIGVVRDGGAYTINRLVFLPPYQMFVVSNEQNVKLYYEQRRNLEDSQPIKFPYKKIVHTRHRAVPGGSYGRPIFTSQSLEAWKQLKQIIKVDLPKRSDSLSKNPDIIEIQSSNIAQAKEYERLWREKKNIGDDDVIVLTGGATFHKGNTVSGDFNSHIELLKQYRYQIIPSGFPTWYFNGLEEGGGADISGQPSTAYSRLRAKWCSLVSGAVRQVLDTEIMLQLGIDRLNTIYENGGYNIEFPEFVVNPNIKSDLEKTMVNEENGIPTDNQQNQR